jgi:hypothetical protein
VQGRSGFLSLARVVKTYNRNFQLPRFLVVAKDVAVCHDKAFCTTSFRFSITRAKVKRVLISAGAFNLHFVGKFAFRRVKLPFAYEVIGRCPGTARKETNNQQQLKSTI